MLWMGGGSSTELLCGGESSVVSIVWSLLGGGMPWGDCVVTGGFAVSGCCLGLLPPCHEYICIALLAGDLHVSAEGCANQASVTFL